MLDVALEREVEGDLLLSDMGQGLGLRPGVMDGAISISAVQWLCNADRTSHDPRLRLKAFFGSLYRCLARGARAVFQLYPENLAQRELILSFAMRAGFAGGMVVDFPHRYANDLFGQSYNKLVFLHVKMVAVHDKSIWSRHKFKVLFF
ncbi:hypothetical protein F2P56_017796, partial [Juglans regia]